MTTTNSAGNQITTTLVVIPNSSNTTTPSNKSSDTGAIVGGVVGGIAVIAFLALCLFLFRRKMKRDEFEANIFDPDRNVERPTSIGVRRGGAGQGFDLNGAGVGAAAGAAGAGAAMAASSHASNVTPYPYDRTSAEPTSTYHGSSVLGAPEMQQQQQSPMSSGYYGDYNYPQQQYGNVPSVGVGETFPNPYAPGYLPVGYGAGVAAGAAAGLNRGPTTMSTTSGNPSVYSPTSESGSLPMGAVAGLASVAPANPRTAKEREAFSRSNTNLAVANPNEPAAPARTNPSPTPSRNSATHPTSPVIVHQDGGRAPDEEPSPEGEIPPTYDSIPHDTR